jgi:hypothetical protein
MSFSYFHDSPLGGHLGVRKTINKVRDQFLWKGMDIDIRARVRAYNTCELSKPAQNTKLGNLASEVAQRPVQKIFIDYVGKFSRSRAGHTAILVCVVAFRKYVWLIPVFQATTSATIKALKEIIIGSFLVPEVVVSDNAQCFTSREFKQFCFELGIKHVTTSPYYLQKTSSCSDLVS